MTRLNWGDAPRPYEEGVDRGVLYSEGEGVVWGGLISVSEEDSSEVNTDYYLDGIRSVITQNLGEYSATIEAFTYPDQFAEHSGYAKTTSGKRFGLSYRTSYGDGHKLHLVYNVLATLSTRQWSTTSDSPSPSSFVWDIFASAIPIPGASPGSHLVLDTTESPEVTAAIEDILYGTETLDPRLPDPEEVVDICERARPFRVVYDGDGTWTATGPDEMIQVYADGSFQLQALSVFHIDEDAFTVSSY
jgi:hypothetical protein